MIRSLLWIVAGAGFGLVVHLMTILALPSLAEDNIWTRISAMDNFEKVLILGEVSATSANPLKLDPELLYGICRLDLTNGVGILNAQMPGDFWSISIFDASGRAVYGTSNRSIIGQTLKLGIFNDAQTKLLADQELEIEEGLLIVESELDDLFVVLRIAPPHQAVRERYKSQLSRATCTSA